MLEKPAIQDFLLTDRLQSQYGLERATLEFLSIGNDVNTAAYRVDTDTQGPLYLKLRHGDFNHASVIVPHLLRARGVRQVIAPLLTTTQQEWTTLNEYSLALYPYIEGQSGFQHPLSDEQWVEFGRAVKVLHTLQVIPELINSIPREKYSSVYRDEVKKILQQIHEGNITDNVSQQFADFMKEHEEQIRHMVQRAEELGEELKNQQQECVLCHADLHAANIMIDTQDQLYIVDWDTLIFAPKERDLMFVGGGVGGAWNRQEEEELFYRGYGSTEINHTALTYYRYERIVQDIVEFSKRLLFTSGGGKDRESSLEKFKHAFEPNNVVEIAKRERNFQPE